MPPTHCRPLLVHTHVRERPYTWLLIVATLIISMTAFIRYPMTSGFATAFVVAILGRSSRRFLAPSDNLRLDEWYQSGA